VISVGIITRTGVDIVVIVCHCSGVDIIIGISH
jgi:hypothetical protein